MGSQLELEVMATHYSQKALCVIGVTSEGHKKVSEAALRSRVNGMVAFTSLETQVTESTPKSFIWHTYEDSGVPVENSMMFASALIAHKVPVELHIYPHGEHGLSLANPLVCSPDGVIPKVQTWIGFAKEWVYDL